MGLDSSVGIAIRYGLGGLVFESQCGVRFSAPVQNGPGAHPASYTVGAGSFPRVKRPGDGVDQPPHLAQRLKKNRDIPLLPFWAFTTCSRVIFTSTFY